MGAAEVSRIQIRAADALWTSALVAEIHLFNRGAGGDRGSHACIRTRGPHA
jgi:hypothetical protein